MIDNLISKIKEKAIENHVPIVRDKTLEKIIEVLNENPVEEILEIGTAVGYSALVMLKNSNAEITTIEKNIDRCKEAKENFKLCNFLDRVNLLNDDALNALQSLEKDCKKFGFIFLDGPKGQYLKYLPYLKKILTPNGIIFADNILLGGLIEDESRVNHKNRTMVKNMKSFIDKIKNDNDFLTEIYTIDDGFIISKLK